MDCLFERELVNRPRLSTVKGSRAASSRSGASAANLPVDTRMASQVKGCRTPTRVGVSTTQADHQGRASYKPPGRKPRGSPIWAYQLAAMGIRLYAVLWSAAIAPPDQCANVSTRCAARFQMNNRSSSRRANTVDFRFGRSCLLRAKVSPLQTPARLRMPTRSWWPSLVRYANGLPPCECLDNEHCRA